MENKVKNKIIAIESSGTLLDFLPERLRRIEFWQEDLESIEVQEETGGDFLKHPAKTVYDSGWYPHVRTDFQITVKGTGNLHVRYTM